MTHDPRYSRAHSRFGRFGAWRYLTGLHCHVVAAGPRLPPRLQPDASHSLDVAHSDHATTHVFTHVQPRATVKIP
jgi:hypothetical protein